MNILIIEDEEPAATRLERLIKMHDPEITVLNKLDSVQNSVKWLTDISNQPDLIFMDIQLADGLSFEIFEHVDIEVPVIFTTAYDEYALKAFKVNSVDYLLKPVDEEELSRAFNKLERLSQQPRDHALLAKQISNAIQRLTTTYKSRFVIRLGEHLRTVEVDDILYFFTRNKGTLCCIGDNRNYMLDQSLEQVQGLVNPGDYFRINRQYLVRLEAIEDIISYSNSRLRLIIRSCDDKDVIVSRDRVNEFKDWLDR